MAGHYTATKLVNLPNLTGTSETTLYTVPASTTAIVKQIVIANVTASANTVGVSLVATGATAGTINRIFFDQSVAAGAVIVLDLSQVLNTGDFISAKTTVAAAFNIHVSGVLIT